MTEFKCSKCNKVFTRFSHITQHLRRKTPCVKGGTVTAIQHTFIHKCTWCYKDFSTKGNMTRHYKVCKIKNGNNTDDIKELKKEVAKLTDIIKNMANQPQTIGTQNNNPQSIQNNAPSIQNNGVMNIFTGPPRVSAEEIFKTPDIIPFGSLAQLNYLSTLSATYKNEITSVLTRAGAWSGLKDTNDLLDIYFGLQAEIKSRNIMYIQDGDTGELECYKSDEWKSIVKSHGVVTLLKFLHKSIFDSPYVLPGMPIADMYQVSKALKDIIIRGHLSPDYEAISQHIYMLINYPSFPIGESSKPEIVDLSMLSCI
jgi:hypothetical protein